MSLLDLEKRGAKLAGQARGFQHNAFGKPGQRSLTGPVPSSRPFTATFWKTVLINLQIYRGHGVTRAPLEGLMFSVQPT